MGEQQKQPDTQGPSARIVNREQAPGGRGGDERVKLWRCLDCGGQYGPDTGNPNEPSEWSWERHGTYGCRGCDAALNRANALLIPEGKVVVTISKKAAGFTVGVMQAMNREKVLPDDSAEALETSAWLEEIEYAFRAALSQSEVADRGTTIAESQQFCSQAGRTFSAPALYAALDSQRRTRDLSWRQLAAELELSPSLLTRLGHGETPRLDAVLALTGWLGMTVDDFVEGPKPTPEEAQATVDRIAHYLRKDRDLRPGGAAAIEQILRTAYEQLTEETDRG